jgi:hypothetical protein
MAFFIAWPVGEFPVNDDWAYTKNVWHLAVKHQFVVDEFPAMNLFSQTLYGSAFVSLFGFSFFILRFSVFLLAVFASFVFKDLANKLCGNNKWMSFLATAFLFFNPLFLALSFTFMTDLFFISLIIFSMNFFYNYWHSGKTRDYVLFVLFCAIAVLCRQQGMVFSIIAITLLFKLDKKVYLRFLFAVAPVVIAWLAHDKYRHYMAVFGIANGIQYTDKLLEYLQSAKWSDHLFHAADSLLVCGSALFPLVLLLIFNRPGFRIKDVPALLFFAAVIGFLVFDEIFRYPLGNISQLLSIGPKVVKTDIPEVLPQWMNLYRWLVAGAAYFSIVVAFWFLIKRTFALIKERNYFLLSLLPVFLVLFVFVAISDAYFDRYSIPLIAVLYLLLIPAEVRLKPGVIKVFVSFAVVIWLLASLEVRDYFSWQRTRWTALRYLEDSGIERTRIDGGFEYNGWYKPNKNYSAKDKSWWWVVDDEYVVSHQELKNYNTDTFLVYQKIIPFRKDTLRVLKRK